MNLSFLTKLQRRHVRVVNKSFLFRIFHDFADVHFNVLLHIQKFTAK
jgi:hypothetical protein